ncbi:hypothetical protein WN55_07766 [Dufourea novaeangliae]|uniref:Uncharacterized protein n=1 Tax=Dufourea novaeangliae TaxID=178035 RepID=A0A154P4K2_DUFNO|nr:hypothetical protein WN55_07766 [Dufourea novaeangliae]
MFRYELYSQVVNKAHEGGEKKNEVVKRENGIVRLYQQNQRDCCEMYLISSDIALLTSPRISLNREKEDSRLDTQSENKSIRTGEEEALKLVIAAELAESDEIRSSSLSPSNTLYNIESTLQDRRHRDVYDGKVNGSFLELNTPEARNQPQPADTRAETTVAMAGCLAPADLYPRSGSIASGQTPKKIDAG